MEFREVVRRRRMVRDYDPDRPVPADVRDRLLEHAIRAPSAGFSQGWAFLVLETPEERDRFWAATTDGGAPDGWLTRMRRAPLLVVPLSHKAAYLDRYAEFDKGWTDRDEGRWPMPFWHMDAAMASLLILQTATDAGLGACFFGVFREPEVRREFEIPERYDPVGVITMGHRVDTLGAAGSPTRRSRTPWTAVVHRGQWGHQSSPSVQ